MQPFQESYRVKLYLGRCVIADEVEICNLALSNIRAGSINSLDESSVQAQQCKLKYSFMRDRCLKDHQWQFNRTIAALASVDVDIFNWAYSYSYPSDCFTIHRIIPEYEEVTGDSELVSRLIDSQVLPVSSYRRQVAYEVFNFDSVRVIGCNETGVRIDYGIKITDPNLFSDDFILALSHLLASEIAIPIVGAEKGRELRSDEIQLYDAYLKSAVTNDKNDGYLESGDSDFVTCRR